MAALHGDADKGDLSRIKLAIKYEQKKVGTYIFRYKRSQRTLTTSLAIVFMAFVQSTYEVTMYFSAHLMN